MPRDVIPFRAGPGRAPGPAVARPNPAYDARPLLRRLADTLAAATPFRDACRTRERQARRWGVPPLFFFADAKAEEHAPVRRTRIPDCYAVPTARRLPTAARAWADLDGLIDEAFTACAVSVDVRRVARATPGLWDRLADHAADHRACREFAALLAAADDLLVTVLHPAARAGFRFQLTGIADLAQLHVLLADLATGSPARGYFPGSRPDPRVADAYLDRPTDPAADVATACFQFFRPAALRGDGTLPAGFAGCDHWLWGHESPAAIPSVNGERVLLVGDAAYPRQWLAGRRFAALAGELRLLRMLTHEDVDGWLATLTGRSAQAPLKRAA